MATKTAENAKRKEEIDAVINYYKKLTGRQKISLENKTRRGGINARLDEGYTVADCYKVLEWKFNQWWHKDEMRHAFNLITLFRPSHFDTYLCEAEENLVKIWLADYDEFIEKIMRTGQRDRYLNWEQYRKLRSKGHKPE